MWCTRWFLPLLLLPLPTAPPYFLVLFILSITMHAKPCFYCIVLLTTLFVSSCYWQPFPIDNPLTTPWSENVTTFADALKASLPSNSTIVLPSVMRAVDRCWCDFSGSFFEPFNVSHWEYLSVLKVSQDLERRQKLDAVLAETKPSSRQDNNPLAVQEPDSSLLHNLWDFLFFPFSLQAYRPNDYLKYHTNHANKMSSIQASLTPSSSFPSEPKTIPFSLRREYDLRPYGLGMVVDLGW